MDQLALVTRLAFVSRLAIALVAFVASRLSQFDSSALLVTTSPWAQSLLRWDAFHFLHIAQQGYVYDYEWAFFFGTPLMMRLGKFFQDDAAVLLFAGVFAAAFCESSRTLYRLSLHHLGSPSLALTATILSLLPSSPATLRMVAYSEPFFTFLSYKGQLNYVLVCILTFCRDAILLSV